jgi:hypothetical protein
MARTELISYLRKWKFASYHENDDALLSVLRGVGRDEEGHAEGVRGEGGEVPCVDERLDQGDGPHRPVAAQVAREQKQPKIDAN